MVHERHKKILSWTKIKYARNSVVLDIVCGALFSNQEDYKSQYGQIASLNNNPMLAISLESITTYTSSTKVELYSISHVIPLLALLTIHLRQIQNEPIKFKMILCGPPAMASKGENR